MFEAQSRPAGAPCDPAARDEFVFAAVRARQTLATVSMQTERRGLMILGGQPCREMLAGPARPRRLAGCWLGVLLASWDAGAALALSVEQPHPAGQALQREGHHAIRAEDPTDHAGGLGPAPVRLGDGVDPEVAGPPVP